MNNPAHRIYLVPDLRGHMQQTQRLTCDFYEIDPNQYLDGPQTHWYHVIRTSPGGAFSTLWEAGRPEVTINVTITGLGAFMRLISDQ